VIELPDHYYSPAKHAVKPQNKKGFGSVSPEAFKKKGNFLPYVPCDQEER